MRSICPGDRVIDKERPASINSMAPTEREIIKLGKDMERMETNSEIERSGMVPDPKQ